MVSTEQRPSACESKLETLEYFFLLLTWEVGSNLGLFDLILWQH